MTKWAAQIQYDNKYLFRLLSKYYSDIKNIIAQQGDAPEPAIHAINASRKSKPPAR